MPSLLHELRRRIRLLVRRMGWDIVRYQPVKPRPPLPRPSPPWTTLLGAANLPIQTVIDAGAKDGDSARFFRRYFPQAVIHCFEPHPVSFQALSEWADTQDPPVHCYHCALGDSPGQALLYSSGSKLFEVSLLPPSTSHQVNAAFMAELTTIPVEVRRLDDVVAGLALVDDILLKVDVEGFDLQVLQGGADLLQRAAACIVEVNIWQRYPNQPTFHEIIERMEAAGLTYAGTLFQGKRPKTDEVTYFDALFIRQDFIRY